MDNFDEIIQRITPRVAPHASPDLKRRIMAEATRRRRPRLLRLPNLSRSAAAITAMVGCAAALAAVCWSVGAFDRPTPPRQAVEAEVPEAAVAPPAALIFEDASLEEIAEAIGERYECRIVYGNRLEARSRRFHLTIGADATLQEAVATVNDAAPGSLNLEGNVVRVL